MLDSWIGSDRFSRMGQACPQVHAEELERVVVEILARPDVSLRMAVLPDDDEAFLGWSVSSDVGPKPCVFYCYVKKHLRRNGIASGLLGSLVTQRCEYAFQPVIHARDFRPPRGFVFNPFRAYRP